MARRPAHRPARKARRKIRAPRNNQWSFAPTTDREKIIAAFLALLADKPFETIGLADIAATGRRVAGAIAR